MAAEEKNKKDADDSDVIINNLLIRSKRQNNLFESKIEVFAIKKLQTNPRTVIEQDARGEDYQMDGVRLTAAELRVLMGKEGSKSHSFYDQISETAERMFAKYVVIRVPGTQKFTYMHYYHKVNYDNGIMDIVFEPAMSPYLKNLSANYTRLSFPILMEFKTNGAFQLYVHLRSYIYKLAENKPDDAEYNMSETLVKTYNVSELRADLGYVNIDSDAGEKVKKEANKDNPNWDKIVENEKKPQYKKWSDFARRVLKPGIEEINEKSDIYVSDMQQIRTGRGGKVTEVRFEIQYNKDFFRKGASDGDTRLVDEVHNIEESYKNISAEVLGEIMSIFPKEDDIISPVDAEILYNDAKGDISKIRDAYRYAKNKDHIDNFMGYMRAAIRNDYAGRKKVEVMNGSKNDAERFHDIMDSIDADMIERNANYWEKRKKGRTVEIKKFDEYLNQFGLSVDSLENSYSKAECGMKLQEFVTTGEVTLKKKKDDQALV